MESAGHNLCRILAGAYKSLRCRRQTARRRGSAHAKYWVSHDMVMSHVQAPWIKPFYSTRPSCWIQISTVGVINDHQKFMTLFFVIPHLSTSYISHYFRAGWHFIFSSKMFGSLQAFFQKHLSTWQLFTPSSLTPARPSRDIPSQSIEHIRVPISVP